MFDTPPGFAEYMCARDVFGVALVNAAVEVVYSAPVKYPPVVGTVGATPNGMDTHACPEPVCAVPITRNWAITMRPARAYCPNCIV
jgi:hypothetical protein